MERVVAIARERLPAWCPAASRGDKRRAIQRAAQRLGQRADVGLVDHRQMAAGDDVQVHVVTHAGPLAVRVKSLPHDPLFGLKHVNAAVV